MHIQSLCPGQEEREEGVGRRLHWQVQGSTSSPDVKVIWNLECPIGFSQKRNTCSFRMKDIGRNLDGPPKGNF